MGTVLASLELSPSNFGFYCAEELSVVLAFKIASVFTKDGNVYAQTGPLQLAPTFATKLRIVEELSNKDKLHILDSYKLNTCVREKD